MKITPGGSNISRVEQLFQEDPRLPPARQAVDRGAQLLVGVLASERPVSVTELARATGLPKSTASRLLGVLERHGLVGPGRSRADCCGPGPAILDLRPAAACTSARIVELAQPSLDALAAASGETINLAVPGAGGVEHLAQVDGRHFLGAGQWVGRRVDYHCTAVGKVFLADGVATLPDGAAAPRAARPAITERAALEARAARGRQRRLRGRDRRARGRSRRGRRAGPRRRRRRRRRARDLRTDAAPGAGRDRPPGAGAEARGGAAEPSPVVPSDRARTRTDRRARRMTHEEILQLLYDETLVGNAPVVRQGVEDGLADGMDPERMLYDALIPSLEEVGARFERGDYFVPEMLIAARAMQGALDILRPLLAESGAAQVGTFVIGTVKGDVHDIGKNLCNIMLEGAGFTVIDLGVNVAPERFVEEVEKHSPDVVGLLGVPDDDDADVQGQHQRAREGRPARQGDRDGRRRAGHAGVRRRRRRRRLLGRRVLGRQEGQGADRATSPAGGGLAVRTGGPR